MAVYIDELMPSPRKGPWRHKVSCHLIADDIEELHDFACFLGLRRAWFQGDSVIPHYDLTRGKRFEAVRLGAIEIDRAEMGRRIHEVRKQRAAADEVTR